MQIEQLDPKLIGARLADARKARGITQEDAAKRLHCSRPTLIALEKGTRNARPEELIALAEMYGRKVHEIVRPGEVMADFQPHLRAVARSMDADTPEIEQAISALQRFAEDCNRLEQLMGVSLRVNYPEEVTLGPHVDVVSFAEDKAIEERQRLRLGDQPVIYVRDLLEVEVGLRIIYEDLPSRIAGMFAFSREFGGVVAVNRKHPPERRRATLLHEYGHLITARYKPGIDYVSYTGRKPADERFAEAFSMAFLMPGTSVRRQFNQVVNDRGDFRIEDLCRLANFYFVSVEAMTIRLEGLTLIPRGTREYLKESRFEVRHASRLLSLHDHPVANNRFSDRYMSLAVHAFDGGKLSEGELATFLRCDRVTARETVEKYLTVSAISDRGELQQMLLESQSGVSLLRKPESTSNAHC